MEATVKFDGRYLEVIVETPRGDVRLTCTEYGAGIGLFGHSTHDSNDGEMDEIVFLAYDVPTPIVLVWADINIEGPTNRIKLFDSLEERRKD